MVTRDFSDWSVAPVPEWIGKEVTIRASKSGDALTIRAKVEGGSFRLVRLSYLDPSKSWKIGPFCCSPIGDKLRVRFTKLVKGPSDKSLHEDYH